MAKGRELKDLEAYILGVIGEQQPCSPYFVHKTFLASPSLFFSGSAGAIYPAINRLEKRGILKSARSGTRGKPSKSLTITAKGEKEYLAWFFDSQKAGDPGFDPLRGRVSMIGALKSKGRMEVFQRLIAAVEERLTTLNNLALKKHSGLGMAQALEMEKATLQAKLKVLKKWQKEASKGG